MYRAGALVREKLGDGRNAGVQIKPVRLFLYMALFAGALVMLFPIVWMAVSTFKSEAEISAYPPALLPKSPTFQSLINAWTRINLRQFFLNSLIVTTIITPLSVLTSVWVGFVVSKYEFRAKELMFYAIIASLMIPAPMLLIPHYQVVLWFGLLNSYSALVLPAVFTPFGIFMMRQYMHSVPDELLDAARIDGASEPRLFVQIVLPLVKPAIAALGIFEFLANWDSFLWPLVVLTREEMYTLPVGLALFAGEYQRNIASRNAGAFIAILPVLVVFLFFQRHIIQGIALTGMKG
jgi:multiple sugar transport system permease protein